MHSVQHEQTSCGQLFLLDLDEIARQGAQRMLAHALQAEVEAYLKAAEGERDESGHALVVRNGYHTERRVLCGAGTIEVRAPRVNDRRVHETTGERKRFRSVILPPYMRRSPKVTEVLPLLYLHGLSTGDFAPALEEFFGTGAGLSPASITRLTEQWQREREAFMERELSASDYVYVWVDGIHTKVRLGQDDRLCCLVMIGVKLDGKKELNRLMRRLPGVRRVVGGVASRPEEARDAGAPVLAIGDGALGFWGALRDAFPETRHQRDWVHKTANVLDALPKSVHKRAKKAIKEITEAENKAEAKRRP